MVLAGDVALTLALVAELVFVATYGLAARWWRSQLGSNLMIEAVMFLGILVYQFWAMWIRPVPPSPAWPRVLIYSLFAAVTAWRWALLIRSQAKGRHEEGGQ